jgi:predicted phosphodiesterase
MKRTDSFPYGDGRLIQIVHDYLPVPAEVKKKLARSRGIGIFNKKTAKFQFDSSPEFFGDILIIGHFHVPAYYVKNGDDVDMKRFKTDGSVELCKEKRYILNPGALKKLKQYRNMEVNGEYVRREARSYAILDTENNIFEVRIIYC